MTYYKRYIPEIELSLEKDSGNVPSDGKYYILKNNKIIAAFRSQKEANKRFEELVFESGFKKDKPEEKRPKSSQESMQRYLDAKALFYAIGPIRKKGGPGGRGGV